MSKWRHKLAFDPTGARLLPVVRRAELAICRRVEQELCAQSVDDASALSFFLIVLCDSHVFSLLFSRSNRYMKAIAFRERAQRSSWTCS